MSDFNKLPPAAAQSRGVYLGDWGGDGVWPWALAIRINVARENHLTALRGVVQQVAQLRLLPKDQGASRLIADFVDELCPRPLVLPPPRGPWPDPPPRPEWTTNVELLGVLAASYPAGSAFAETAFDLAKRTLDRAQDLHKQQTA